MARNQYLDKLHATGGPVRIGPVIVHFDISQGRYLLECYSLRSEFNYGSIQDDNHLEHECMQLYDQARSRNHGVSRQSINSMYSNPSQGFSGGGGGGGQGKVSYPGPYPTHFYWDECKPKEVFKNTGIRVGEILGWRGWRAQDGFLRSTAKECIWSPSEPMRAVDKTDGNSFSVGEYGLYAFKTESEFLTFFWKEYKSTEGIFLYGKVHLWGHIFEHELGYRAEFAKVLSLQAVLKPPKNRSKVGLLREFRQTYGCVGVN